MQRRFASLGLLGALFALTLPGQSQAQDWPVRPVRMIVPNPAGGTAEDRKSVV